MQLFVVYGSKVQVAKSVSVHVAGRGGGAENLRAVSNRNLTISRHVRSHGHAYVRDSKYKCKPPAASQTEGLTAKPGQN